jgi:hypothetical protein
VIFEDFELSPFNSGTDQNRNATKLQIVHLPAASRLTYRIGLAKEPS